MPRPRRCLCSICGIPGHRSTTCPEAGNQTTATQPQQQDSAIVTPAFPLVSSICISIILLLARLAYITSCYIHCFVYGACPNDCVMAEKVMKNKIPNPAIL